MAEDLPAAWRRDQRRTYTPADGDDELEYATYLHESGDLRLRIAPASLDGYETPGYTLRATTYPGLDFSETFRIRQVLTFGRCRAIAVRFMELFAAAYDGPADLEGALEYAFDRTKASGVTDGPLDLGTDGIDERRD